MCPNGAIGGQGVTATKVDRAKAVAPSKGRGVVSSNKLRVSRAVPSASASPASVPSAVRARSGENGANVAAKVPWSRQAAQRVQPTSRANDATGARGKNVPNGGREPSGASTVPIGQTAEFVPSGPSVQSTRAENLRRREKPVRVAAGVVVDGGIAAVVAVRVPSLAMPMLEWRLPLRWSQRLKLRNPSALRHSTAVRSGL